jgi:hypothetical protein
MRLLKRTPSRTTSLPSVSVGKQWVECGGRKILWLPLDYRPITTAVHGGIVAFGCRSGRVLIMEFTP